MINGVKFNTKEIELFGEKLILSERTAGDIFALQEFAKINDNVGLYLVAVRVRDALKINKKEMPVLPKTNLFNTILRKFGLDKKYTAYVNMLERNLEFNSKLTTEYILNNLTQPELFTILKQANILEGIENDESTEEKKKLNQ